MSRSPAPERPKCISCGRPVQSGVKCVSTTCPYEKSVNHAGVSVIARPVRKQWIT